MANQFSPMSALEAIYPRSMKYLSDYLTNLVAGRLWLKVMIAMFLGLAIGILMGPSVGWVEPANAATIGSWLALPGQLFLALVQMIVIPLVVASIIRGLAASEDFEQLRKIGMRVVIFFVVTTAIATTIGLTLATVIKPGQTISSEVVQATLGNVRAIPKPQAEHAAPKLGEVPQKLLTLLPGNPLSSMVESQMLHVVVFSMIFGVALVTMAPSQSKPMLDLLGSLQEVCMTIVRWAMRLAPIAVFGLLAQLTMKIGLNALFGMAVYVFTVLLGLAFMYIIYLLVVFFLAAQSPKKFISSTREVLLLAFSTSSSAAVMPLSIKTAEEKLGVRPSISQFVIPLGATINMNGTALYQGVAAIFLAQVYGVDIGMGGMLLIVAMAVGASIGSPATPGVGIVILSMVLTTVGIPASGIALLMGVDRILDMSRTAINVAGDLVACKLMDGWVGGKTTAEEQLEKEAELEKLRAQTGSDVVTEKST
jgi:Na+/H+-dicarboxylate symporter